MARMKWPAAKLSTLRRQKNEKANKRDRRRVRLIKAIWPAVDETYKEWIRGLPCAACFMGYRGAVEPAREPLPLVLYLEFIANAYTWAGRSSVSECAHIGAIRGLNQKCSDRETAPLCGRHHDRGEPEGHHDLGVTFWTYHGINRDELIAGLNGLYLESGAK